MAARNLALLIAFAACACSTPDRDPREGRIEIPTSVPPAEADRPDAGAARPRLPALSLGRPMLVDFTREDCLPCKLMEPWLAELRRRHAGVVEILEVDLDRPESRDVARFFKARSVPTQVYVDARGREVSRDVGLATLPQMQSKLEKLGFLRGDGRNGKQGSHGSVP